MKFNPAYQGDLRGMDGAVVFANECERLMGPYNSFALTDPSPEDPGISVITDAFLKSGLLLENLEPALFRMKGAWFYGERLKQKQFTRYSEWQWMRDLIRGEIQTLIETRYRDYPAWLSMDYGWRVHRIITRSYPDKTHTHFVDFIHQGRVITVGKWKVSTHPFGWVQFPHTDRHYFRVPQVTQHTLRMKGVMGPILYSVVGPNDNLMIQSCRPDGDGEWYWTGATLPQRSYFMSLG